MRENVRTDFGNTACADIAEGPLHFVGKDLDRPRGAGLTTACCPVQRCPADQHHLRTEGQRFDDVAAATHTAVEYDRTAIADRLHNLRKHVYGRYGTVEGASTVIRDDDTISARIDGRPCLIATQNAFHDELARPEVAEFTNVVPGHRLERLRTRARLAIENGVAVTVGKI